MSTVNIALGASISSAIAANTGVTTFQLASGIYYAQGFQPKVGNIFLGDSGGGTVLSGAIKITSWSGSGSAWHATAGTDDGGAVSTLPQNSDHFTGSISGSTLTITALAGGLTMQPSGFSGLPAGIFATPTLWNRAGTIGNGLWIVSQLTGTTGSTGTYQLSASVATVASGTIYIGPQQANSVQGTSGNYQASLTEDLYVAGVRYTRVPSPGPAAAGTWWFDPTNNSINVNSNLTGTLVEYAVTPGIYYGHNGGGGFPGASYTQITFEKWATPAEIGVIHQADNHNFTDCKFQHNHGAGLVIGAGTTVSGTTTAASLFDDNGQAGIEGGNAGGATGSTITNSTITNNNWAQFNPSWDAGGIKMGDANNMVVTNNQIHDNGGPGIWADVNSGTWTITGNTIYNNVGAGIQYEVSSGTSGAHTTITNNYVAGGGGDQYAIYISNSSYVDITGNTVYGGSGNTGPFGGIVLENQSRPDATSSTVAHVAVNHNTIVQTSGNPYTGLVQYSGTFFTASTNVLFDYNTYYTPDNTSQFWEFDTSGTSHTIQTWAQVQSTGIQEQHGTNLVGTPMTSITLTLTQP